MSQIPPETIKLIERIAELKKAGLPNRIIAKQHGLPLHKVEYLVSCFVSPNRGNKKLSRGLCIEIAKEYLEGCEEKAMKRLLSYANPRATMKSLKMRVAGPLLDHIPETLDVKSRLSMLEGA